MKEKQQRIINLIFLREIYEKSINSININYIKGVNKLNSYSNKESYIINSKENKLDKWVSINLL